MKECYGPEISAFLFLHLVIKIARRTVDVFFGKGALGIFPCKRAGHNPARSSGVLSAVNAVEPLILCSRAGVKFLRAGAAGLAAAKHIFPAIEMPQKFSFSGTFSHTLSIS